MRDFAGKRYWLVGASEGLGLALAHKISAAGAEVIVTARNAERLDEVVAALPGRAKALPCDIADTDAVKMAAREAGDIDGVVFLASVYWPMSATEWDADKVVAMADINFTGAMRVLGEVVPGMVARDAGHIVITGSLAVYRGLPGAIGYGQSKAALMSLAESMHIDLRHTGVDVQIANPGYIRTRQTAKNTIPMPFIMEPDEAAQELFELMCSDRFKKAYPRFFSWFFRLGQFLPESIYYRLFG